MPDFGLHCALSTHFISFLARFDKVCNKPAQSVHHRSYHGVQAPGWSGAQLQEGLQEEREMGKRTVESGWVGMCVSSLPAPYQYQCKYQHRRVGDGRLGTFCAGAGANADKGESLVTARGRVRVQVCVLVRVKARARGTCPHHEWTSWRTHGWGGVRVVVWEGQRNAGRWPWGGGAGRGMV